ncbi:CENP-B protein [Calocera cornea HHB12733]|uniref:CENP-B protein n=1 Tax=Calocera cornea HHB12733 TaxID=1353952 RepID=A0A165CP49_9BASI|nr:CENP-B protein [Calocera cornea HHB12733]
MLVLDGHESHVNAEFNTYCKEHDIIPLCLPPHSSHLTQPLDISLFGPLKRAYSDKINNLVRGGVTHIKKDDFFPAFRAAFQVAFKEQNIKSGFRAAGLVPFNPDAVLSKLTLRL